MRVDFYQLAPTVGPEDVAARLAAKIVDQGERLLIVAEDEALLARLDRQLWEGERTSFLPHGLAGDEFEPRQPVLLSSGVDAANGARNLMIADGQWREAALGFERAFYLFGGDTLDGARLAWKLLSGREGVERNFWANDGGKWVRRA